MYGIYQYSNGLHFTGKITNTKEEAIEYLKKEHGYWTQRWTGEYDEYGNHIYEKYFFPSYNERAFEILELEMI